MDWKLVKTKYCTWNVPEQPKNEHLETGNLKIGQIKPFQYLGAIVNEDKPI
jgi:hypothetical protein